MGNLKCTHSITTFRSCSRPAKKGEKWCWQHMPPREIGDCSICLEKCMTNKQGGEKTHTTKCGHTFHTKCIKGWFEKGENNGVVKCPMCREVLLNNKPLVGNDEIHVFDLTDGSVNWTGSINGLPGETMVPPLDIERLQIVAMISPNVAGSFISSAAIPARHVSTALSAEPDPLIRQQLSEMFASMMR